MTGTNIVFLPGIMGSTLVYRGAGPDLSTVVEPVWDEDPLVIFDTLASRPERLMGPLTPGRVIESINFLGMAFDVYQTFMNSLRMLGYWEEDGRLIPFAYDWRADLQITAERLAGELLGKKTPADFILIGHSMGCLVIRLALLHSEALRERTRHFIQIAPPVRGSALAYRTLKVAPSLSPAFDRILRAMQVMKRTLAPRLHDALVECDSIFQLLPPADERILGKRSGQAFAAVDPNVWPNTLHDRLNRIIPNGHRAAQCDFPEVTTFYGTSVVTPWQFIVDEGFVIQGNVKTRTRGDGTVTVASAAFATPEGRHKPIAGSLARHDDLPRNPEVLEKIRAIIDA